MKVFIPSRFNTRSMYGFIGQVLNSDMLPRHHEFTFDFTKLKFIEPVGVTIISNLIGRLRKHDCKVFFEYRKPDRSDRKCPMAFLDDAMFFKHYLKDTLDESACLRPTTLPLQNVTYPESYQYLSNAMEWLSLKLNLTKSSLAEIETCLKEMFNNIKDHSSENNGNIFIQQFPNEKKVTISLSDFGVGIPYNIQGQHPTVTDGRALEMAVQEGFSTKSTPQNRGAGLDFLLHNVVKNNNGDVYIHSNHGILSCKNDGFGGMNISHENVEGFYPGTLLNITFKTDAIENVEEEFLW